MQECLNTPGELCANCNQVCTGAFCTACGREVRFGASASARRSTCQAAHVLYLIRQAKLATMVLHVKQYIVYTPFGAAALILDQAATKVWERRWVINVNFCGWIKQHTSLVNRKTRKLSYITHAQ